MSKKNKRRQRELPRFTKKTKKNITLLSRPKKSNLTLIEDNRTTKWDSDKIPKKINGLPSKIYDKWYPGNKSRLAFAQPKSVIICKRRKKRREILFKFGKAGKGKKPNKIRKYTQYSNVRC